MNGTASTDTRFEFGANWSRFLGLLNQQRISDARQSLSTMLSMPSLEGKTFLDAGNGSGLFSLAACQLGAARVHSFDYDQNSVRCAEELRRRFSPSTAWTIEQGSVLDGTYLRSLGQWDVVYSWGVLHHTGQMWKALELVAGLVKPGGTLFISIYNDQGLRSKIWAIEKRWYVRHVWLRPVLVLGYLVYGAVRDVTRGEAPWRRYRDDAGRGMSWYHDMLDWLGGYPFEVASPEAIQAFFAARGFVLRRSVHRASGCNEFVFDLTPAV